MPILRLLGGQLAIGAAAIFTRLALEGAGPLAVSALRLGLATLVLVLLGTRPRGLGRRREVALACAGLALAAHFAAWIASLQYTSVARATLLVTTTPLWLAVAGALRTRRFPSRAVVAALVLALAGVAVVAVGSGGRDAPIRGHDGLGETLALGGAIAIGFYLELVRTAGGGNAPASTGQIVLRTYGWAAVVLVVGAAALREPPPPFGAAHAWFGIAGMVLGSQLLGHTALARALRDFTPTTVATSTLLEPVIAAGLAAPIFGERVGPAVVVGGILLLAGIALALRADGASQFEATAAPP